MYVPPEANGTNKSALQTLFVLLHDTEAETACDHIDNDKVLTQPLFSIKKFEKSLYGMYGVS